MIWGRRPSGWRPRPFSPGRKRVSGALRVRTRSAPSRSTTAPPLATPSSPIGRGSVLAIGALAKREYEEARRHLEAIRDNARQAGEGNPGVLWWQGDYLEALCGARCRDGLASTELENLAGDVQAPSSTWIRATVMVNSAVLDRANDPGPRLGSAADALAGLPAPFEARTGAARLGRASAVPGTERWKPARPQPASSSPSGPCRGRTERAVAVSSRRRMTPRVVWQQC